ncbi:MAG: hypothetical protein ACREEM_34875 [Blastocatellia bacterium]
MSHKATLLEDDLADDIAPEYDLTTMERATGQERRFHPQATVLMEVLLSQSLFDLAETVAQEMKISRNDLIASALNEFFQRYQNRQLFEAINEAYKDGPTEEERQLLQHMKLHHRRILEDEW